MPLLSRSRSASPPPPHLPTGRVPSLQATGGHWIPSSANPGLAQPSGCTGPVGQDAHGTPAVGGELLLRPMLYVLWLMCHSDHHRTLLRVLLLERSPGECVYSGVGVTFTIFFIPWRADTVWCAMTSLVCGVWMFILGGLIANEYPYVGEWFTHTSSTEFSVRGCFSPPPPLPPSLPTIRACLPDPPHDPPCP